MALSPALRELVATVAAKYEQSDKPACGIIPLSPVDPRMSLIYNVAEMISDAITGPEVHAWELAEMIVDVVEDHHA